MTVAGDTYALPVPYKTLLKDGWEPEYDLSKETIEGEHYVSSITLLKKNSSIRVRIYNMGKDTIALADGVVGCIQINPAECSFDLAGIGNSTTEEELLALAGEGIDPYHGSGDTEYTYNDSLYGRFVTITCATGGKITKVSVTGATPQFTYAPTKAGDALRSAYQAPEALGTELMEPVFQLMGDLYRFPAPLSAFLENGWKVVSALTGADYLLAGNGVASVNIYKGNALLQLSVVNSGDAAISIGDGMVIALESDSTSESAYQGLVLSGNVPYGAVLADCEKAYGGKLTDPIDLGDGKYICYDLHEQDKHFSQIILYFDQAAGTLAGATVYCNHTGF